jgi:hypothetical protein
MTRWGAVLRSAIRKSDFSIRRKGETDNAAAHAATMPFQTGAAAESRRREPRGVNAVLQPRKSGLAVRSLSCTLIAASLAACGGGPVPSPATTYDPEVIGVIESATGLQGGGAVVNLASGQSVTLGVAPTALNGTGLDPGDLFLYGRRADGEWYARIRPAEGGCYALDEPAVEAGAFIHFSIGLRLPKTPNFDPGVVDDGRFNAIGHGFCISDRGQVVAYE